MGILTLPSFLEGIVVVCSRLLGGIVAPGVFLGGMVEPVELLGGVVVELVGNKVEEGVSGLTVLMLLVVVGMSVFVVSSEAPCVVVG